MWYRLATFKENVEIPISQGLMTLLTALKDKGYTPYIVGGAVRDAIMGYTPKDLDIEVYKATPEQIISVLKSVKEPKVYFASDEPVGKSFAVIKAYINTPEGREEYDFNLPRRETKTGTSHKDFMVFLDPNITPKEAASRRDFTVNSLFYDPFTKKVYDYFNGIEDIKNRVLRHTSSAFSEDPVRVLRAIRFAAQKGFTIDPDTAELCKSIVDHYSYLPWERVLGEFEKIIQSRYPGAMLKALQDVGWDVHFPEIKALQGVKQEPEYHPEGWSFTVISADAFRTGVATAKPIDLLTREVLLASTTHPTGTEAGNITASTKFIIKSAIFGGDLFSANATGVGDFLFSPLVNSPTSLTPTKGLVGKVRRTAQKADKIVGVVFKIPVSRMLAIMESAVNYSEIINRVIQPVSVYVMNVLGGKNFSTKVEIHNIPMKEHTLLGNPAWNGDFSISSSIIQPKFSIIDNNVVFYFYLGSVGDVDTHINNIGDVDLHILVNIGDVATHTAHVMNAAAEIADRHHLSKDERAVLVWAALAHDFAKPATTQVQIKKGVPRITSNGHEQAGGPIAREFLTRMGVSKKMIDKIVKLVEHHLRHITFKPNSPPQEVRKLAESLYPATIKELMYLIEADHSGRPPLPKELPKEAFYMGEIAEKEGLLHQKAPDLISGKDIMELGVKEGVKIGELLKDVRKAYLRGIIHNREEALYYLKNLVLKSSGPIIRGDNPIFAEYGVKGRDLGKIKGEAFEAQLRNEFNEETADEWLRNRLSNEF